MVTTFLLAQLPVVPQGTSLLSWQVLAPQGWLKQRPPPASDWLGLGGAPEQAFLQVPRWQWCWPSPP